jgi:S1-C subfamily serine protease
LNLRWEQAEASDSAGAVVESVEVASAAERAGFRGRDLILKADGETVTGPYRLAGIVQSRPEGTSVSFEVAREGKRVSLTCVLSRYQRETK